MVHERLEGILEERKLERDREREIRERKERGGESESGSESVR